MLVFVENSGVMPRGFSNPASAEKISKRLVLLRKALRHTQESLAERLEIGRSQLSNYESGEPERIITLGVAIDLCQLSGATLDWIYRGTEFYLPPDLKEELRVQERLLAERDKRRPKRGA
jgi:transcriptional regulator with XRE-family HTH domain